MPNTGLIKREQLEYIDKVVYSPKQVDLIGRSLFQSIKCKPWQHYYDYDVLTGNAKAREFTNRQTDIPTVDATITSNSVPITEYTLAADYSVEELGEAQEAGFDLLNTKAQLVARGMAEYEDKLIFNGLSKSDSNLSMDILGLTSPVSKTGFQEIKAPDTLENMTKSDNIKLRNFFQVAVNKITSLAGYANAKPILALPRAEMITLDRPFNEYNPQQTVLSMIQPWFSKVITVPNFEAKNFGGASNKKDMGMIFLNDRDVVGIPDAMPLHHLPTEYSHTTTTIPYMERTGGLAIRYPSAFVRIDGIN